MMPEYGHALLCPALGVALPLSVYPLVYARRRADDACRPVFAAAVYLRGVGAFFVLVHAFVVNDFTGLCRRQLEHAVPPVVPVAATRGARLLLLLWVLLMSG